MGMTSSASRRAFADEGFGTDGPALDLVNSEQWDGFGRRTDHLDDPDWLADFRARYGWGVAGQAPPLADLRRLRTALRGIVEAAASGAAPPPADLAVVEAALAEPAVRVLRRGGDGVTLALAPVEPGWRWALAEIAAAAVELLASAPTRIKTCANPGSRWAFRDRSRGNTRRWCNDLTCGNRDKVRRFRARARTGGAPPSARGSGV
jgi:predicted RNA-binding Zn ribbon-like protein